MSLSLQKEELEAMMKEPSVGKQVGIVRLCLVREERSLYGMEQLSGPEDAAQMVRPLFAMADREMMVVVSITTKMEPLALEIVAIGGINSCIVDIRNLFKHSLLNNAAGILCFHNHPSGNCEPSQQDCEVTQRIHQAGEILGIELIDHIILGEEECYSFRKHGQIASAAASCMIESNRSHGHNGLTD